MVLVKQASAMVAATMGSTARYGAVPTAPTGSRCLRRALRALVTAVETPNRESAVTANAAFNSSRPTLATAARSMIERALSVMARSIPLPFAWVRSRGGRPPSDHHRRVR